MTQKLLLLAFTGLFSLSVLAQAKDSSNKEVILTKICDCISNKEKTNTSLELEAVMQECMMGVIMEDPLGNLMDLGLTDFEDQKAMEKFGMTIGLELAKKCPALAKLYSSQAKVGVTIGAPGVEGKFIKMELDGLQYVVVEDKSGTQFKLLLLQKFDDAETFIKDNSKLIGKTITFQYKEIETYNPKTKAFNFNKVITGYKVVN